MATSMTEAMRSAWRALRGCTPPAGPHPSASANQPDVETTVRDFNRIFYDGPQAAPLFKTTSWLGVNAQKCPMDTWIYQEILWEKRPELIVETGVFAGGSTLFLASMFDLIGAGEVLAIDITLRYVDERVPRHPRIRLVEGNSIDPAIASQVRAACRGRRTMVILDSDHTRAHVAAELAIYAPLVTPGQYLIVEDTNINGHPVYESFGPGPHEAVQEFLRHHGGWTVDRSRERLLVTFNPAGYLLRVGS